MRNWRRKALASSATAGLALVAIPLTVGGVAAAQSTSPTVSDGNPNLPANAATAVTITTTLTEPITTGSVLKIDLPVNSNPSTALTFTGTGTVTNSDGTVVATSALATDKADPQPPAVPNAYTGTDEIDVTFTTGSTGTANDTVTITGYSIKVPAGAATGSVNATDTYTDAGANAQYPAASFAAGTVISLPVKAAITPIGITVVPTGTQPVTPLPAVTLTEPAVGAFGEQATPTTTSYSYSLTSPATSFSGTPKVTANYGTVSAVTPVAPDANGNYTGFTFTYTPPAGSAPTTPLAFTISGLSAVGSVPGFAVTGSLTPAGGTAVGTAQYGTTIGLDPAIYGQYDYDTAAAVFNQRYTGHGGSTPTSGTGDHSAAVLATDYTFPDALGASYLAQAVGTGTLLTTPGSLPDSTKQAIIADGVQTVYVVGGPNVVSQHVIDQVQALVVNNSSVKVVQIYGNTAFDTNQAITQYVSQLTNAAGATTPGSKDLSGAFTNEAKYNDTTGKESPSTTAPGAVPTAIVASGDEFQDALAAGPLSDAAGLPVIITDGGTLSPQASAQLTALGIKQVILMGGPAAVSDTVEQAIANPTSANGLGIPVLRVAGQDASDTADLLAGFEETYYGFSTGGLVNLTRADGFSDALAAGPYLGSLTAGGKTSGPEPLYLSATGSTTGATFDKFLKTEGNASSPATLGTYVIQPFGGPLSLSPNLITTVENDLAQTPGIDFGGILLGPLNKAS